MCSVLVCLLFGYFSKAGSTRRKHWSDLFCFYIVHVFVLLLLSSVFSKAAPSRRREAGEDDKWRQDEDKSLQHHFGSPAVFFGQLCTNIIFSLLEETNLYFKYSSYCLYESGNCLWTCPTLTLPAQGWEAVLYQESSDRKVKWAEITATPSIKTTSIMHYVGIHSVL